MWIWYLNLIYVWRRKETFSNLPKINPKNDIKELFLWSSSLLGYRNRVLVLSGQRHVLWIRVTITAWMSFHSFHLKSRTPEERACLCFQVAAVRNGCDFAQSCFKTTSVPSHSKRLLYPTSKLCSDATCLALFGRIWQTSFGHK